MFQVSPAYCQQPTLESAVHRPHSVLSLMQPAMTCHYATYSDPLVPSQGPTCTAVQTSIAAAISKELYIKTVYYYTADVVRMSPTDAMLTHLQDAVYMLSSCKALTPHWR